MRDDFWIERASKLEPFDGKGFSASYVAKQTGLTTATVKKYAAKFGFDFDPAPKALKTENKYEKRRLSIIELASEGLTRQEVAERLGLNMRIVGDIGRELKVKFRHASEGVGSDFERAEAMAAMFKGGKTLQEIGTLYGVSRERVRQIIKKHHGLVGVDGGQAALAQRKKDAAKAKKDAYSLRRHGCVYDDYLMLVRIGKEITADGGTRERTPAGAWGSQRANAKRRGIEWKLKLWDWWQIWQDSGKWAKRGCGKTAYVMCRFNDSGAYEVGNVYIATHSHNSRVQPNNPYRLSHADHDKVMADRAARREARAAA